MHPPLPLVVGGLAWWLSFFLFLSLYAFLSSGYNQWLIYLLLYNAFWFLISRECFNWFNVLYRMTRR